jgi:hypothetical protein
MAVGSTPRLAAAILLQTAAAGLGDTGERPQRSRLAALLDDPPEPARVPAKDERDWLTAADVAIWMGVAERDVTWAAEQDELPYLQVGRTRLFSRAALALFPLERWRVRRERRDARAISQ